MRDGVLLAAAQQERFTRKKADGQGALSNRLPLRVCLQAANLSLSDVDIIVSSFQAAAPGGVGLHRPLIESDFSLFDPNDSRHLVISHHRAHALAAFGTSGFESSAILVCDLGGSSTTDGLDFEMPFPEFADSFLSLRDSSPVRTECLSIYLVDLSECALLQRSFVIPHNAPDIFVYNAASLYDNVARMIFLTENAHGQLMALSSMASAESRTRSAIQSEDIVDIEPGGRITFHNDWQRRVIRHPDILDNAPLASAVQTAFQRTLLVSAGQAKRITGSRRLIGSGGVFLNILANSEIRQGGLFEDFYVPSNPHDAGIAAGCAYAGIRMLAHRKGKATPRSLRNPSDFLGPRYDSATVRASIRAKDGAVSPGSASKPARIAGLLANGEIVARWAQRSEFGPRALGARSLLASPLCADSKSRLNLIKGRQQWRPVAPIILHEKISAFLDGPTDSPYMNFVHAIKPVHRGSLAALAHPDGSTRAQTLKRPDDPFLYDVIAEFEKLTGYPIIVNTSLNGPGEPIVEAPDEAVQFFLDHVDVNSLLIDEWLVVREPSTASGDMRVAPDTLISQLFPGGPRRIVMAGQNAAVEISQGLLDAIDSCGRISADRISPVLEQQMIEARRAGLIVPA